MIRLQSRTVPYSELSYIGFRLAYSDTCERLELAHQLDLGRERSFGYLSEVPFLRHVPVQVQLDLLLETWSRHLDSREWQATLVDESVLYAAFETAARMIRIEPTIASRFLARGPIPCAVSLNQSYAEALQKLHLQLVGEGRFLLFSRFQDLSPDMAEAAKRKHGIPPAAGECLFEVLSRWYVSRELETRSVGLLTEDETRRLLSLFDAAGCCLK